MRLDHGPRFPSRIPPVAMVGCGRIARDAHLPAYRKYGVPVAGVWSPSGAKGVQEEFPEVARVYESLDELLLDQSVTIVDIATGPGPRVELIARCVEAGKHVLAQKPLVSTNADRVAVEPILQRAQAQGLKIAVNQNGRWAPPWRLATLLVRDGAIGTVVGVTHLHDKPLPPIAGTHFDDIPHMLISDYLVHWVDITRQWLDQPVIQVTARDNRVPDQPTEARNPWAAEVSMRTEHGATALLRVVGNVHARRGGTPFWIHGTTGTLRGSILLDSDMLSLEDISGNTQHFELQGQWFVDGFAGAMAELMAAVADDREPEHCALEVLGTVDVVDAAVRSAEAGGTPQEVARGLSRD